MAKPKADTSAKNCPAAKPSPYAPANLFQLVPGIQWVVIISGRAATLTAQDESGAAKVIEGFPQGEYIILKVTDPITDKPGVYQVPPPRKKE